MFTAKEMPGLCSRKRRPVQSSEQVLTKIVLNRLTCLVKYSVDDILKQFHFSQLIGFHISSKLSPFACNIKSSFLGKVQ